MNLRVSLLARTWPSLWRYANALFGALLVVSGLVLLAALRLGWIDILPHSSAVGETDPAQQSAAPITTVELTPEKMAAAGIHCSTVSTQMVYPTREVPGEIAYDEQKHVPVNSPADGVVLEVKAAHSQRVAKDQLLAVLSCPDVGVARDAVDKRKADLELARQEEQRADRIESNLVELLTLLKQKPTPEAVEAALEDRPLGTYREKIMGAYSTLVLREREVQNSTDLLGGTLSEKLIRERKSARENAAAQYLTACDTSKFDAHRDRERYQAAREQAERLLAVAEQALANLLGPWAVMETVTDRERINELKLKAPLAGWVVERHTVPNARVTAGAPLFTVADTRVMWVSTEIHERDWQTLDFVRPGDNLELRIPFLSADLFTAKILHVGSQLGDVKRSVPLVAELPNPDGRIKPGMIVRTLIPLEQPHEGIVIPASAITRHENQPFVFVPDGERKFRRVDVQLGLEERDRIEVVSGLKPGDTIVDGGTFYLKSELLLEREE